MSNSLKPHEWEFLLTRIIDGECTPFLGAGISAEKIPAGKIMAKELLNEAKCHVKEQDDLVRVSQAAALMYDPVWPKRTIVKKWFEKPTPPNPEDLNDPHNVLARLPIPIYITTNYDLLLEEALKAIGKEPIQEYCRWSSFLKNQAKVLTRDIEPTVDKPLVFHLHGHYKKLESMVLTEDDYLDFLVGLSIGLEKSSPSSSNQNEIPFLPLVIQNALSGSSLMLIGYSLADWDFRVLLRGLFKNVQKGMQYGCINVQYPRPASDEEQDQLKKYFMRELSPELIFYWGKAREFTTELNNYWAKFKENK